MFDEGDLEEEEDFDMRNHLEDARAALTRPERCPAEAINHIERCLEILAGRGVK